jgi:hypothetical protein
VNAFFPLRDATRHDGCGESGDKDAQHLSHFADGLCGNRVNPLKLQD